jgi:outer membrane receptor protein involved in Fe transport
MLGTVVLVAVIWMLALVAPFDFFWRDLSFDWKFALFATPELVPFDHPALSTPVTFRQSATDADNHLQANVAGAFLQDQVDLSKYIQLIGGVRFDRFDLTFHNNRTGETLSRADDLVSPRAGVVFKPIAPVSIYGMATGESIAHLNCLIARGKIRRTRDANGVDWYQTA